MDQPSTQPEAPAPAIASTPSRRAFLLIGGSFAVGATLGSAGGFAIGSAEASGATTRRDEQHMSAESADELAELRWLAVSAPIDSLMDKSLVFANLVRGTYRDDATLWRGMARITEALLAGYPLPDRRVSAIWIAQVIEDSASPHAADLKEQTPLLRRIR